MPDYLSEAARVEWVRITGELTRAGILEEVHGDLVGQYCETLVEVRRCEEQLAKDGMVTARGDDGIGPHPCIAIRNAAVRRMRQLAHDLGLMPYSNARRMRKPAKDFHGEGAGAEDQSSALRLYDRANRKRQAN